MVLATCEADSRRSCTVSYHGHAVISWLVGAAVANDTVSVKVI